MDLMQWLALNRKMRLNLNLYVVPPHLGYHSAVLATDGADLIPAGPTVEQGDGIVGLKAQHLHMSRCACWEIEKCTWTKRSSAEETRHIKLGEGQARMGVCEQFVLVIAY
jgi:hypothetical protein